MSLQYSLDLKPSRPPSLPIPRRLSASPRPPINKLMLMAKPDEADANRIARIADERVTQLGFGGRLVRPDLLHFTLYLIGLFPDVPQSIIDAVVRCGNTVGMRPFIVSLDTVMNFHRRNGPPLIVLCGNDGVLGLRMLHKMLGVALARTLGPGRSMPFEPHMTLSYRAMEIPRTAIEPIRFTIREFVLVNSIFGTSRHDVLLRWHLGD
jgi:RNA 2',3'-cyclic 3'-phosphodiesterase